MKRSDISFQNEENMAAKTGDAALIAAQEEWIKRNAAALMGSPRVSERNDVLADTRIYRALPASLRRAWLVRWHARQMFVGKGG